MRISLEEGKRVGSEFANPGEILRITDLRQARELLVFRQARQVVDSLRVDANNVMPNGLRQRRLAEKFRPGYRAHACDEAIFAKGFAIKEASCIQFRVQILVVSFVKTGSFYTAIVDNPLCHFAVAGRVLD